MSLLFSDSKREPNAELGAKPTVDWSAHSLRLSSSVGRIPISPDGKRVVFGGNTWMPGLPGFANVYVAGRLGNNLRQITKNYTDPSVDWLPVQWSRNGRRILVVKLIAIGEWYDRPRQEMRILDLDTGSQVHLPEGEASAGACFQP